MHFQLLEDVLNVTARGELGNVQPFGDLRRGPARLASAKEMKKKVVIRPRAKLEHAHLALHELLIFRLQHEAELANNFSAVRHFHDGALLRTIPIAELIAPAKQFRTVGADCLLGSKTEESPRRVVPEDNSVH